MCVLCIHIRKQSLTPKEIVQNLKEMYPDDNDPHAEELFEAMESTDAEYQKELANEIMKEAL